MILAVTAFVPLPGHPRSTEEYHRLGKQLMAIEVPLLCFEAQLEQCWLWQYLQQQYADRKFTYSVDDNPLKNSVGYLCVQAQKSTWLALAADFVEHTDVLVWIDYGIFNLTGMTGQVIQDFMLRAADEQAITIPGCWDRDYEYDDRRPCWRFCGGVLVMPKQYAGVFDSVMQEEYKRHLRETNNLSWEVNTMARVEERHPELPIWWYRANHDQTLFTNYKATESADGYQTQVRGFESRYS